MDRTIAVHFLTTINDIVGYTDSITRQVITRLVTPSKIVVLNFLFLVHTLIFFVICKRFSRNHLFTFRILTYGRSQNYLTESKLETHCFYFITDKSLLRYLKQYNSSLLITHSVVCSLPCLHGPSIVGDLNAR